MAVNNKLITARMLAEALDLSVETIWRYTRENKIPYVELGSKQYRYRLDEVMESLTVREKGGRYDERPGGKLTGGDYWAAREESGHCYEILEGRPVKEPLPGVVHQRVSRRLQRILEDYFDGLDPEGEVFNAPLEVLLNDVTVVQPDLFYVSGEQRDMVKDTRIEGSPALVVEIISLFSSRKDRLQKMQIYQRARVEHYWLVDPKQKTLECFALREGLYTLVAAGMDEEQVEHPDFIGLAVGLSVLWPGMEQL